MKKRGFNFGWQLVVGTRRNQKPAVTVDLPNDYISTLERSPQSPGGGSVGFFPSEDAEYTNTLFVPEDFDGTMLMELDGAYEKAEVYVDHNLVCMHPYGYTGMVCDLTKWLHPGNNKIRIFTSCRHPGSRWYTGGGLYRMVTLHEGGKVYIHPWNVFVTTPEVSAEKAEVALDCTITNAKEACQAVVKAFVLDAEGRIAAETRQDVTLSEGENALKLALCVDSPALWSIEEPNLYTARVVVEYAGGEEVQNVTFGIRKIEIDAKNGFRLNGKPMKLLGGCIHHDSGFLGAAAFPRSEERKIQLLKEAGFNAIRTAHNPPSTALLDACDRLGMLVLDESFDCWRVKKNPLDYHQYFEKWWDYDTAAMVKRDRNHPSVYCWSIGNEIMEFDGASDGVYWGKLQADLVRSLDPTRPVSSGINMACGRPSDYFEGMDYTQMAYEMAHTTGIYDGVDRWAEATEGNIANLDIAGYNYMYVRYASDREKFPDRIIQGTETMPFYALDNWEAVKSNPNVIGDFLWVAYDNLGEAGMGKINWTQKTPEGVGFPGMSFPGWPWMSCWQGDLDMTGFRRPASYFRSVMWGHDKGIHLFTRHPSRTEYECLGNGWHWEEIAPDWTYEDQWLGKDTVVVAYTDADRVDFLLNGKVAASVVPEKYEARALIPYEKGILEAVAYRNGEEAARDVLRTAGSAAKILLTADRPVLSADGMDLSYVRAQVVDKDGIPLLADGREITVSVSGAGSLAGLGSGNPCTEENFGTGRRLTFQGSVTAALRAGREAGTIEAAFVTPGLPAAIIKIEVK